MNIQKKIALFLFTIIILSFIIYFSVFPMPVLTVKDMYTNEIIICQTLGEDKTFSMQWIHSVELEPWIEDFKIDSKGDIVLTSTHFKAYGAGVPDSGGNRTEVKDGFITYYGIDRTIPDLTYGVSPIAQHTLTIGSTTYELYKMLTPDTGIRLQGETVGLFEFIGYKFSSYLHQL